MQKLLIIEDDLNLALSIREGLKYIGLDLIPVGDGKKGLSLALQNNYEAIIIDFTLPGYSGDEIIRRIRAKSLETPILMLTARNETSDLIESLNLGADDYMTKPFSMMELQARITRLIRRPPVTKLRTVKVGNIGFDLNNKSVILEGKTIYLTRKETALLEFFLIHKNSLVSREQILANVWSDKTDLKENTIDCYISSLRKKINFRCKDVFIKTAHGSGYIFVA